MIVYNFALFILFNFGISYIITHAKIFEKIRNLFIKINPGFLGKLIICILCTGTWIGFLLSVVYSPSYLLFTDIRIVSIFLDGILGGITSYFLCMLYCWIGKKSDF
jgi:hypothetical protein